jgi:hypothetical protein
LRQEQLILEIAYAHPLLQDYAKEFSYSSEMTEEGYSGLLTVSFSKEILLL